MALKEFYREDLLGHVTPSNSIPWLYDLDATDDDDEPAATSLVADEHLVDGGVSTALRADDDSLFTAPLDQSVCGRPAGAPDRTSRDEGFMKSFSESLSNSVVHDVDHDDADERKLSVGDGAAVSRLTTWHVRSVAVLGVATTLSQAPFCGVRGFQSTLNGSLGRSALIAYYASLTLAAPLVDSTGLQSARFRPKTALVLSVVACFPFSVVAAFRARPDTASLLLPVTAAVAGAATTWMTSVQDAYVTSLGASCAALSSDRRSVGRAEARHFINVFSYYLLAMQHLSLLVGGFASSSVLLMTRNLPAALSTSLGIARCWAHSMGP